MEGGVMAKESVEFMQETINSNWNRGNTDQRKPVVMDITTLDPGRGKRFDLNRSDAVFLYETAHSEEQPEVFYDFVHTRINVTVDIRTVRGRTQLMKMEDEVRRIVHLREKETVKTAIDCYSRRERTYLIGRSIYIE
jgi:hypothetical protein